FTYNILKKDRRGSTTPKNAGRFLGTCEDLRRKSAMAYAVDILDACPQFGAAQPRRAANLFRLAQTKRRFTQAAEAHRTDPGSDSKLRAQPYILFRLNITNELLGAIQTLFMTQEIIEAEDLFKPGP